MTAGSHGPLRVCLCSTCQTWKGGILEICVCCGSPVVCDRLNSLPHAAHVLVEVVPLKFFQVNPFCCSDGLLQLVPGSLIHHLISWLDDLPSLPDFLFYVPIEPGFLVGEHTHNPGRGMDLVTHNFCVLMDTVCSLFKKALVCGLQTALRASLSCIGQTVTGCVKPFVVNWFNSDNQVIRHNKVRVGFSWKGISDVVVAVIQYFLTPGGESQKTKLCLSLLFPQLYFYLHQLLSLHFLPFYITYTYKASLTYYNQVHVHFKLDKTLSGLFNESYDHFFFISYFIYLFAFVCWNIFYLG